jgi:3-hydroxyacyl-CoA dehydrogenase / enoyl-CoA hydratase / 3-hydroxybutyryl-CoA epimerase
MDIQSIENSASSEAKDSNKHDKLIILSEIKSGIFTLALGNSSEKSVILTENRLTELEKVLQELVSLKPRGLAIVGNNPDMFCLGADVSVIEKIEKTSEAERLASYGQQVFNFLESLPFRKIAAISGPCVGGAFELALACNYRICSDNKSTKIGLPEIKLGIIPGFGGTQRLPRLIGLPRALDIILGGKILPAKAATDFGLVDETVTYHHLLDRAYSILEDSNYKGFRERLDFKARFLTFSRLGRYLVVKKVAESLLKKSHPEFKAPNLAINAVVNGLQNGLEEGLRSEVRAIGNLATADTSKALIHLYYKSEDSRKLGRIDKAYLNDLGIVVIGAGIMGSGIAELFAQNSIPVTVRDINLDVLEKSRRRIINNINNNFRLSSSEKLATIDKLTFADQSHTTKYQNNIIIEAVFEDLETKIKLLTEVASTLNSETVICSNTSSLSITKMSENLPKPELFIGMHFFNPVIKMPLVEIVQGRDSNPEVVLTIAGLANRLGKYPVIVNDVPGFLVNRILFPYLNAAGILLENGHSAQKIDELAKMFGMPMGPLRLLDEVGHDVASSVGRVMEEGYGNRMKSVGISTKLTELKRLGSKSKRGLYKFTENGKSEFDPEVIEMLNLPTTPKQQLSDSDIADLLIFSLLNEAVRCLDEGVAGTPSPEAAGQVDLATVMGIGFPAFRGGAIRYTSHLGTKKIADSLNRFADLFGERFNPWEGLLERIKN